MVTGLVVFDLDGTLLRGDTVCELLAKPLGCSDQMKQFEMLTSEADIIAARLEMLKWYSDHSPELLQSHLTNACLAPGAREAIMQLQAAGVVIGIASITWKFAVKWFADQLNIEHVLGTDVTADNQVIHVFGSDKAEWLQMLANRYDVLQHRIAAVGDSRSDVEMLRLAGLPFFVGLNLPAELQSLAIHMPNGDLRDISRRVLREWTRDASA